MADTTIRVRRDRQKRNASNRALDTLPSCLRLNTQLLRSNHCDPLAASISFGLVTAFPRTVA
jgi:hypothetical protein